MEYGEICHMVHCVFSFFYLSSHFFTVSVEDGLVGIWWKTPSLLNWTARDISVSCFWRKAFLPPHAVKRVHNELDSSVKSGCCISSLFYVNSPFITLKSEWHWSWNHQLQFSITLVQNWIFSIVIFVPGTALSSYKFPLKVWCKEQNAVV